MFVSPVMRGDKRGINGNEYQINNQSIETHKSSGMIKSTISQLKICKSIKINTKSTWIKNILAHHTIQVGQEEGKITRPMDVISRKGSPCIEHCNNGQYQVHWRDVRIPTQRSYDRTHWDRDWPSTEMLVNNGHYAKDTMSKCKVDVIRVNTKQKWNQDNKSPNHAGKGVKSEFTY